MNNIAIKFKPTKEGVLEPVSYSVENASDIQIPKQKGYSRTEEGILVQNPSELDFLAGFKESENGIMHPDYSGWNKTKDGVMVPGTSDFKDYKSFNFKKAAKIAAMLLAGVGTAAVSGCATSSGMGSDLFDDGVGVNLDNKAFNGEAKISGTFQEEYSKVYERVKGEFDLGSLLIDAYARHSNSTSEREGNDLRVDSNKFSLGINYPIEIGEDMYLIPGLEGIHRVVKYEGGNSPDNKFADMPGAKLEFVNEDSGTRAFLRYRNGKGEYEFQDVTKQYKEAEFYASVSQQLTDKLSVLAANKRFHDEYEDVQKNKVNGLRAGIELNDFLGMDDIKILGEMIQRYSSDGKENANNAILGFEKEINDYLKTGFDVIIPLKTDKEMEKGSGFSWYLKAGF